MTSEEEKQNMLEQMISIAKTWGIFAAFSVAFVFWQQNDKMAMNQRLDAQQQFIQKELMGALNKCTVALEAVARSNKMTNEELRAMRGDPTTTPE